MAYIRVNHKKFEDVADAIDKYVSALKSGMLQADIDMKMVLGMGWSGADFEQFKQEWSKVDDKDSVHAQMIKSLESYAKYLRYAASEYKKAQSSAVNRANSLPRY